MGLLDGFTICSYVSTRPGWGKSRVTISSKQITFSKNLVIELGSPKRVNIYRKESQFAITPTNRGGFGFATGRKDKKVIRKDEELLEFLHGLVGPTSPGVYYCIEAEIVREEGKVIALFDADHATRIEMEPETLEKLKNGRKRARELRLPFTLDSHFSTR